jgi:hypothetical protein
MSEGALTGDGEALACALADVVNFSDRSAT